MGCHFLYFTQSTEAKAGEEGDAVVVTVGHQLPPPAVLSPHPVGGKGEERGYRRCSLVRSLSQPTVEATVVSARPPQAIQVTVHKLHGQLFLVRFGQREIGAIRHIHQGQDLLPLWAGEARSQGPRWQQATSPRIPEVSIPENLAVNVVFSSRYEINKAFAVLKEIASGRDLKKFLAVIAGLWVLSILGSCCSFLTLFYTMFVTLHTVPILYQKYEDKIDSFAEKAMAEIKKQYEVFDAKVLSKISRGLLKDKKH